MLTATESKLGYWSALSLGLIGILYAAVTIVAMAEAGFTDPIVGPFLTVMEALTLLCAPVLVVLFAALQAGAAPSHRVVASVSLVFASLAAGLTASVHFVSLTALRQSGQQILAWPSPLYALELLAWDLFLGLALLTAAPLYARAKPGLRIRRGLQAVAACCLLGLLGPLSGDMRFQFIAAFGYGILLPLVWLAMAFDFTRCAARANNG